MTYEEYMNNTSNTTENIEDIFFNSIYTSLLDGYADYCSNATQVNRIIGRVGSWKRVSIIVSAQVQEDGYKYYHLLPIKCYKKVNNKDMEIKCLSFISNKDISERFKIVYDFKSEEDPSLNQHIVLKDYGERKLNDLLFKSVVDFSNKINE